MNESKSREGRSNVLLPGRMDSVRWSCWAILFPVPYYCSTCTVGRSKQPSLSLSLKSTSTFRPAGTVTRLQYISLATLLYSTLLYSSPLPFPPQAWLSVLGLRFISSPSDCLPGPPLSQPLNYSTLNPSTLTYASSLS